jgi:hypothetical protein
MRVGMTIADALANVGERFRSLDATAAPIRITVDGESEATVMTLLNN